MLTRLLAIGMFAGDNKSAYEAEADFDALHPDVQARWMLRAEELEATTRRENVSFNSLVRTHEELAEEIKHRCVRILRVLYERRNEWKEIRRAFKRAGYNDDFSTLGFSEAEIVTHKGSQQKIVSICCREWHCGDEEVSWLWVPLDVFEAGPDAFSRWVDGLLDIDEQATIEEKARTEEALRRAQEERDRVEYERLKAKFEVNPLT